MLIIQKRYSEFNPNSRDYQDVYGGNLNPATNTGGEKQWVRVNFKKTETLIPGEGTSTGLTSRAGLSGDGGGILSPLKSAFKDNPSLAPGLAAAGLLTAGYALHRARKKKKQGY